MTMVMGLRSPDEINLIETICFRHPRRKTKSSTTRRGTRETCRSTRMLPSSTRNLSAVFRANLEEPEDSRG